MEPNYRFTDLLTARKDILSNLYNEALAQTDKLRIVNGKLRMVNGKLFVRKTCSEISHSQLPNDLALA